MPKINTTIRTVEMHTGGGPLRIIESGYPEIVGETILKKRAYVRDNLDHLRKFLMFEPRGHSDMYGALPVTPDHRDADCAFLFLHNEGYSTMCGHAMIALGRYCVDKKLVNYQEPETKVNIQCPCGLVEVFVSCSNGTSDAVRFFSVPAFAYKVGLDINVPEYGNVTVDISYGGAYYIILPISSVGLAFGKTSITDIKVAAKAIKKTCMENIKIDHPGDLDLAFFYGVILTDGNDVNYSVPSANIVEFANEQIDRSPCGSGVTARMALMFAKNQIKLGERKTISNFLTKSSFTGVVTKVVDSEMGKVVVEVCGNAYYTGTCCFTAEENDPQQLGFLVK
nr:trans-L-3-hydroxyproline dehydratase-like [Ciona intestinalis]|eukprot:XP_026691825.1 trans-L-3-hydroxyproline dehydratase-like [Ciona intestinalis]